MGLSHLSQSLRQTKQCVRRLMKACVKLDEGETAKLKGFENLWRVL